MERFDILYGKFVPKKIDTLRPEAKEKVGIETFWQCAWIIEDGIYKGQWALTPHDSKGFNFGWIPEEDLEIYFTCG